MFFSRLNLGRAFNNFALFLVQFVVLGFGLAFPGSVSAQNAEANKKMAEAAKAAAQQAAAGPRGAVAPAADSDEFINPNTLIEDDFRYNSVGKRDPFLPFDLSPKVNREGPLTPLERYSLGELRLTSVLKDTNQENKAMVENAAGQGFIVRVGTRIGEAGGVVVKILEDRMQILESNVDVVTGKNVESIKEIKIQGKADGSDIKKLKKR